MANQVSTRVKYSADGKYIRKAKLTIKEVESLLKDIVIQNLDNADTKLKVQVKDIHIKALSDRYKLFFTKGYKCVECGLKASHFALEKDKKNSEALRYHLNLYAKLPDGMEMMFVKDHIIPKSRGGLDELSNYQVMCKSCSNKKGRELRQTNQEELINE